MTLPCQTELVFLITNSDGLKPERLIPQIIDHTNFQSLLLMVFQQAVPDLLVFIFHPDMPRWKTGKSQVMEPFPEALRLA